MENLEQAIARIRAGDIDLYGKIVDAYEGIVRAVVAAMVPDRNLIPDMTQQVFLIAYNRLDTYKPGSNFAAWLRAIARNVAQNERRRWYRRREIENGFRMEIAERLEPHIDQILEESPEDIQNALTDCLTRLQGRSRDVVEGFYFNRKPLNDLAALLQVSATSARVILHRARQAIGSCLLKKGKCHV